MRTALPLLGWLFACCLSRRKAYALLSTRQPLKPTQQNARLPHAHNRESTTTAPRAHMMQSPCHLRSNSCLSSCRKVSRSVQFCQAPTASAGPSAKPQLYRERRQQSRNPVYRSAHQPCLFSTQLCSSKEGPQTCMYVPRAKPEHLCQVNQRPASRRSRLAQYKRRRACKAKPASCDSLQLTHQLANRASRQPSAACLSWYSTQPSASTQKETTDNTRHTTYQHLNHHLTVNNICYMAGLGSIQESNAWKVAYCNVSQIVTWPQIVTRYRL